MDTPTLPPLPQMPIGNTVVTSTQSPKRKINKKLIVTFVVILFLTIGTVSGVLLLRQQQLLNQKAQGVTGLQCNQIKAYDSNWVQLSGSDLSLLKAGDIVRFASIGTGLQAQYKAARFKINGVQLPDTTLKTPTGDYYYSYTIPENLTSFSVTAQLQGAADSKWY